MRNATNLMSGSRLDALAGLEDPDGLRDAARTLRAGVMADLPELLDEWSTRFEAHGGHVHWAADAAEATATVRDLVRAQQARTVAKGKSMASEEIHLNDVLEADGVEVVETDLGEFIIQLADETPSHIIAPAIHHDRYDVADLFAADGGHPVEADVDAEAAYAQVRLRESLPGRRCRHLRRQLRDRRHRFDLPGRERGQRPHVHLGAARSTSPSWGWSGSSGTGRSSTSCSGLLARSATGQALSVYTNIITGPRRPGDVDGPDEVHVVVLDNGRTRILGGTSSRRRCTASAAAPA